MDDICKHDIRYEVIELSGVYFIRFVGKKSAYVKGRIADNALKEVHKADNHKVDRTRPCQLEQLLGFLAQLEYGGVFFEGDHGVVLANKRGQD